MKKKDKLLYMSLVSLTIGSILFYIGFVQAYNMYTHVDGAQPEYLYIIAIQSTSFSTVISSLSYVIIGSIFISIFVNQKTKTIFYASFVYIPIAIFSLIKINRDVGSFGNIFYHSDPGRIIAENIHHFYLTFYWFLFLIPSLFMLPKMIMTLINKINEDLT